MDNVGGVFVVLVGGCVFAVFVTAAEFYFKTRENAKANGVRKGIMLKGIHFNCQKFLFLLPYIDCFMLSLFPFFKDDVNEALSKELKFALAFSGDSKAVEYL